MTGVAVVAAGAAARALDDLLFAFRSADATGASRALPLRRIGIEPSAMLAQLESAGVIRAGDDPTSRYLDERALRAYQMQQQRRLPVLLALAGAILLFAAGAMAFLVSRR
jgi:hypothetical protein